MTCAGPWGESLGTGYQSERNKVIGLGKIIKRSDLVPRSLMKSQSYLSVKVQLCCPHLSSFLTLKHPRGFDYTFLLRLLETVIAGNTMKFTVSSLHPILSLFISKL